MSAHYFPFGRWKKWNMVKSLTWVQSAASATLRPQRQVASCVPVSHLYLCLDDVVRFHLPKLLNWNVQFDFFFDKIYKFTDYIKLNGFHGDSGRWFMVCDPGPSVCAPVSDHVCLSPEVGGSQSSCLSAKWFDPESFLPTTSDQTQKSAKNRFCSTQTVTSRLFFLVSFCGAAGNGNHPPAGGNIIH